MLDTRIFVVTRLERRSSFLSIQLFHIPQQFSYGRVVLIINSSHSTATMDITSRAAWIEPLSSYTFIKKSGHMTWPWRMTSTTPFPLHTKAHHVPPALVRRLNQSHHTFVDSELAPCLKSDDIPWNAFSPGRRQRCRAAC